MQNARHVQVYAHVRYWEDASIDGVEDTDGKIPLRQGESWNPKIDLDSGEVVGWPLGLTAAIHYKVCDQGEYFLLDADGQRIAKYKGHYVPDEVLCVGENGYGDYIIFKIGADGRIVNWKRPHLDPDRWMPLNQAG